ncbi:thiazole synthase [Caballeronia mineralivorans]|jgi:thiazole synthase|uniref:thiazole synthase n=1 Tax=Caballeronia mineralivorans TaxID=2010198 RepID=UPI0023F4FAE1|nr:thiazole synthase [Caballeronia mineralivorans]MDB5780850.1 thiamine biosynthesis protein ThiG [Caballeronia mineralivorans]MEA3102612.1 thiazole synthase [Caballeronia mineralivorans]
MASVTKTPAQSADCGKDDCWRIGRHTFTSRLLLGTAAYPSIDVLDRSVENSGTQILTVGIYSARTEEQALAFEVIQSAAHRGVRLLPNTAGCQSADEAVQHAHMAREVFGTDWIKLEVVGDADTLQPDPFELVDAAARLAREGFTVFPYCTEDLILCRRLLDAGCPLLMPWAAPIGSGQGLLNRAGLRSLRERLPNSILIIDAGIGAPSDAQLAMEMGFDAVLLNSAVARARDPARMALAFRLGIESGRHAWLAGVMERHDAAIATTPQ